MMGTTTAENPAVAPTAQPSNRAHDAGAAGDGGLVPAANEGNGPDAAQDPPKAPKVVGPNILGKREEYQLVRRLQSALFGGVYEANGLTSGKEFAIKVLHKSELSKAREANCIEFCEIPLSEIRFSELMQGDEHVMEVEEYFEDAYCFYVVFELARGGDLLEALKQKPHGFEEAHAQYYIKQAALGLLFLHRRRVAMQDVSLENMLLHVDERSGDFQVKICDPGQAIVFDHGQNGEELPVAFRGLVGKSFRPPELHEQRPYCSTKVDSWCLGWSTFYLLTAHPLFMSADPSQKDADWALFRQDPVALMRQKGNLCSDTGIDFILKLLQIDPSRRMSIEEALRHAWLVGPDIAPVPAPNELLPESMQRKDGETTNSEVRAPSASLTQEEAASLSKAGFFEASSLGVTERRVPSESSSAQRTGFTSLSGNGLQPRGSAAVSTSSRSRQHPLGAAFSGPQRALPADAAGTPKGDSIGGSVQASRPGLTSGGRSVTYVVATNHSPAPQQRVHHHTAAAAAAPQPVKSSSSSSPTRQVPGAYRTVMGNSRQASPVPGASAQMGGRIPGRPSGTLPQTQLSQHTPPGASPLQKRPSMLDPAAKSTQNSYQTPRQPARPAHSPLPRPPSRDPVKATDVLMGDTHSVNNYVAPPSGLAQKAAAAVPENVINGEVSSSDDRALAANFWAFRADSFQLADGPQLRGAGPRASPSVVSPGRGSTPGAPAAAAVPAPSRIALIRAGGPHLATDSSNRARQTPLRGQGNTIYMPRSSSPVQQKPTSSLPPQEQQNGSKVAGVVPHATGHGSAALQPGTQYARVLSPSPATGSYRSLSPSGSCGSAGPSVSASLGPSIPVGDAAIGFSWSQAPSAAYSPRAGSPFELRAVSPVPPMFTRGNPGGITWSPGPPSPRVPSRPMSPAPAVQYVVQRAVAARTSVSPGPGSQSRA